MTIETISQKGDEPAIQNMKHLDTQGRAVPVAASRNSIIAGHEESSAGGEKLGTENIGATARKQWGNGASGGGEEPRIENVVWRTYEEVVDRERARMVNEEDGRGRFELRWSDCALRNC